MSESKILLTDVYKSFNSKKVLQGINLDVAQGESLVVIGGSGSGKSVLIKNIIGLIQPDAGSILIDGEDTCRKSGPARDKLMKKFGLLFQGGALFDSMNVWENIAFGLIQSEKMTKPQAKEIAMAKLQSVGLDDKVAYLFPSELSGGMQKRVSLARAIAREPEIIFFDEPTTGLDPIMADVINDLIIKCSEGTKTTTLTITHDMHSVRKIADRVAMIYEGRIIWHGKKEDLDHSGNEYVDQFIHGRAEGPIKMQIQDH